jgi:hypothetical protein
MRFEYGFSSVSIIKKLALITELSGRSVFFQNFESDYFWNTEQMYYVISIALYFFKTINNSRISYLQGLRKWTLKATLYRKYIVRFNSCIT